MVLLHTVLCFVHTIVSCAGITRGPVLYIVPGAAVLRAPVGVAVSGPAAGPSDAITDMDAIWVWGIEGECMLSVYRIR